MSVKQVNKGALNVARARKLRQLLGNDTATAVGKRVAKYEAGLQAAKLSHKAMQTVVKELTPEDATELVASILGREFPESERLESVVAEIVTLFMQEPIVIEGEEPEMLADEDMEDAEDEQVVDETAAKSRSMQPVRDAALKALLDSAASNDVSLKALQELATETVQTLSALGARIRRLEATVNQSPRRASEAAETIVDDPSAIVGDIKSVDKFWGVAVKETFDV